MLSTSDSLNIDSNTTHSRAFGRNSPRGGRSLPACERCRNKHQKCDLAVNRNTCSPCERAGLLCSQSRQPDLRIKLVDIPSSKRKRRKSAPGRTSARLKVVQQATRSELVDAGEDGPGNRSSAIPPTQCPQKRSLKRPLASQNQGSAVPSDHDPDPSVSAPASTASPQFWPLSREEARLVKYFFTNLVSWFDYCIPDRHFQTVVGATVTKDPSILFAVLAISARHRELTMGISSCNSHEYEGRCLEVLIPSLNDTSKALDDSVLASAMLLRLLEEMSEPTEEQVFTSHAVSTPILLQIKGGNVRPSGFSDAAMIVALRQEIVIGNMVKRAVEPSLASCNANWSLAPADDATWTYRMIAHAARVTTFAYGNGPKAKLEWDRLWQYVLDWEQRKPDSFQPIHYSHRTQLWTFRLRPENPGDAPSASANGDSLLPVIYYTYDCPIAGQQYLQLSRILLLAHDPRLPSLGMGRAQYLQKQEEEMRNAVRVICGIAMSNPEYMPAKLTAGLAIALGGELFDDPEETRELMHLVAEAELHVGWPCLRVSHRLRAFWGLEGNLE
ncbi:Zn(II)2Cys6 transcription factor [Aspergillus aculeatinus CBS 121060]|uniref:Uncharacterized protein n=1 Tax=Aspergillus aculeatinus CBS 121060 TaxID=1448322 RepID=A0ACD1H8C7_9EURO|nr:hypothetical protein BO66DRAFT_438759 [Aspergillus aculeatinus CBS 121060]RAH70056.1 hypothetical protein BO66DRAFT_438759 [Aspergillus aculeatinus CBS 121060]